MCVYIDCVKSILKDNNVDFDIPAVAHNSQNSVALIFTLLVLFQTQYSL